MKKVANGLMALVQEGDDIKLIQPLYRGALLSALLSLGVSDTS
jgi:hypothetical protein